MIKKALLLLGSVAMINAFAGGIDEAMLASAATQGSAVYYNCIVTPPISAEQQAICAALYAKYVATLAVLNAPYPLIPSLDPDPYAWSPYDICRFEAGHIVFGMQLAVPYCPSI